MINHKKVGFTQRLQGGEDFLEVIAQAGHDAHAGHNDTSHEFLLSLGCEDRVNMALIIKNNTGSENSLSHTVAVGSGNVREPWPEWVSGALRRRRCW